MKKVIVILILLSTTLFSNSIVKNDKWGIEINPTSPISWGVGLNVGAYLMGDNDIFDNGASWFGDKWHIVDIEFFKFGVTY